MLETESGLQEAKFYFSSGPLDVILEVLMNRKSAVPSQIFFFIFIFLFKKLIALYFTSSSHNRFKLILFQIG